MADTYWQLAGTGYGSVSNPADVPGGATIITLATYNGLVAATAAAEAAAGTADRTALEAKFLQVFKAYRALGMTPADAQAAATVVGLVPSGFNPVTEPFVPLHITYQTPNTTFVPHVIAAAAGTYEKITELADLVIVEPGVYLVSWEARGVAVIPPGTTAASTGTTVAIFRDLVQVTGSESELVLVSQAAATTTEPALQIQASGGGTMIMTISANQHLSLSAKRSNAIGTNSIISDAEGRCRIAAQRISY